MEKRAVFLEALAVNLGNLKTALGFAEKPDAAEKFAEIDRKSDKIELSLGGIFNMFKSLFSNEG